MNKSVIVFLREGWRFWYFKKIESISLMIWCIKQAKSREFFLTHVFEVCNLCIHSLIWQDYLIQDAGGSGHPGWSGDISALEDGNPQLARLSIALLMANQSQVILFGKYRECYMHNELTELCWVNRHLSVCSIPPIKRTLACFKIIKLNCLTLARW